MSQGQLRAVLGYLHRVADPNSGGPDDAQLLERWRNQRDPLAFEVLVWRHGAMVWNVCRRILGRQPDVEDAFQATFLTFLRKAATIGHGRFLSSWLYKVAYRTALAARTLSAKHRVHERLDVDFPEQDGSGADGWDELGPVLDEEISRLPEKYRRPVVLCYLEGKTTDEAARDLGCPRGTVGTRLAWARERLRSRLTRRGLALSVAGLATLLSEKAATASVPAPLVLSLVKAATFSTAGNALAAGVISARAAALTQGVLQAMFLTKLKTIALVLFVVSILGSGAGLLAHQALADQNKSDIQSTKAEPPIVAQSPVTPGDRHSKSVEDNPVVAKEDKVAAAKDKGESESPQLSGKVVRVDKDGKSLGLEIQSKEDGVQKVDVQLTDKTRLVFSNVGPNEAKPAEGHLAHVWLEKDSKDVASRVQLRGQRSIADPSGNEKTAPAQLALPVVAVAADGKSITLESGKVESVKLVIQLTEQTSVFFFNVARDGGKPAVGQVARVWLEDHSRDTAKAVKFVGNAEGKPAEGKGEPADHTGRVAALSANGKILTVEVPVGKGETEKTEIKLTDTTKESYHGVAAGAAKPVVGDSVLVWLTQGSQDTAGRVRFTRPDPRKSVAGKVLSVSGDGNRFTVETTPEGKGDAVRREIKITAKTRLVFSNVGPSGAKVTEGYHVHGWLIEGSEDTADELMLSRSEKTGDKNPVDKNPDEKK